jgi:ligand-binding SRPBCC domain-containing protein
MPIITITTEIAAPIERVFDLSRSIDLHAASTAHTGERAVAGVTTGLIGLGEEVTWRAKHFGVWLRLTSRITQFDRPQRFRDSMVRGAFRRFDHDHIFSEQGGITTMNDVFDYDAPLGPLGRIADYVFLERYMRELLVTRNRYIKQAAETEAWRTLLG